jgi:hypothetical protein
MPLVALPFPTFDVSDRRQLLCGLIAYHSKKKSPTPQILSEINSDDRRQIKSFRGLECSIGVSLEIRESADYSVRFLPDNCDLILTALQVDL